MKTEQIQVPDGYELQQVSEGKWELVKEELTLEQILGRSFTLSLKIIGTNATIHYNGDEQQIEKLSAISKLMCVANYLNDDWQPNWSDNEEKWCIEWYEPDHTLLVESLCTYSTTGEVVFKTKELAQEAVKICGEQLVKTALGV